jgi:RNA polymerase sigma-70 factor (ECF subfamily)
MVRESEHTDLVAAARAGSGEAMSQLAECVSLRLKPYLRRFVCDEDAGEDLLQEILLTVVEFLGRLERCESFWPWVYAVARSKVRQHYRDAMQMKTVQLESLDGFCRWTDTPLARMAREETNRAVLDAVGQLQGKHRDIVVLHCLEQRSFSEIAARTASSLQQVRTRFYRARRRLRRMLCAGRLGWELGTIG